MRYRVVQVRAQHHSREAAVLSEHSTIGQAFVELDALHDVMHRAGVTRDGLELIVIDERGDRVHRPGATRSINYGG